MFKKFEYTHLKKSSFRRSPNDLHNRFFFKIESIVDDNFALKTVGDFESQPAFAGASCLFSGLYNKGFLC